MTAREDSNQLSPQSSGRGFSVSGQTLWQWRKEAQQQAIAARIDVEEVDWLLQDLAGLERQSLRLETFKDRAEIRLGLPLAQLTKLWKHRIQNRVPVQYLTGVAPWREFLLNVSPAVLIPRPETECLIDLAIAAARSTPLLTQGHWADLGTGSGAIAIGLASVFPTATVHAVDCSAPALAIAHSNAQTLRLTNRIQFYEGSWLQPLVQLKGRLSGIVANPPYIPSQMVSELQPEVAWHEPHLALDGGMDGLEYMRHLAAAAPAYLLPGGIWLVETMSGQASAVAALLEQQQSYHQIQIHSDLAGIDRFVLAYRH